MNACQAGAFTVTAGKESEVPPAQKDSAFVASHTDVEKALPMAKTDSAADLASSRNDDPAKAVIYQDKMADQNAPQRSVKLDKNQRMFWGIGVAVLSGIVGSLFSPGFNVVTNDAFHTLAPGVEPLTVYTGYVIAMFMQGCCCPVPVNGLHNHMCFLSPA